MTSERVRGNDQGQTSGVVAQNVRNLRECRQWSLRVAAGRLTGAGRKITASGWQKIESGSRRVDVDDLVALSEVFEVSPNALLGITANQADVEAAVPVDLLLAAIHKHQRTIAMEKP